jgi:hypothetical protein
MALNYTPSVKVIHTLWIHRLQGTDFLVRGPLEKLVKLAEAVVGEPGRYTDDGGFECSSPSLQTAIYEDGYEPCKVFYNTIAYVERNDAYIMTITGVEPEDHFKGLKQPFDMEGLEYPYEFVWPEGFKMVEREAPYDFTRKMPSPDEIEANLSSYHEEGLQLAEHNDDDICMFCHTPISSCPEDGDHSVEMREIMSRIRGRRHAVRRKIDM